MVGKGLSAPTPTPGSGGGVGDRPADLVPYSVRQCAFIGRVLHWQADSDLYRLQRLQVPNGGEALEESVP